MSGLTMESMLERYGGTTLRYYLQAEARRLRPDDRVTICMRRRIPLRETELWYLPEKRRGYISGLMRCGSGWMCPVCAAAIAEQRRAELSAAIDENRDRFFTLLVTYTAQHNAGDRLTMVLQDMQTAYRRVRSGRGWQDIKSEWLLVHGVRATEITYGDNGWHPHYHELLFLDNDLLKIASITEARDSLRNAIEARWIEALSKQGRGALRGVALDISDKPGDVADYITKYGRQPATAGEAWGEAAEISKANVKRAAPGGRTPHQLLWDSSKGDQQASGLWVEYAKATKGRSQLQWTRGAKDDLGVGNVSDMDAVKADEKDPAKVLLATIPAPMWRVIARENRLAQILRLVELGDFAGAYDVLDEIAKRARLSEPEPFDW